MAGIIRIGLSGWTYARWRGVFYPNDLPHKRELHYAARQFPSIEINGTHYRLQRPESFGRWREDTPDDFVFAIKGSRFITHMLKLRNAQAGLANFMASGLLRLGPKLGPILWQFPARMKFHAVLFERFLQALPRDMKAAQKLARLHDARLDGRDWLNIDANHALRHAVEIRHDSFLTEEFLALLRRYNTALVVADSVDWPLTMDLTADFVYCRLHGSQQLYTSGYGPKALDEWARLVRAWTRGQDPARNSIGARRIGKRTKPRPQGRDVFVYFDNDAKVRAPKDALALIKRLERGPSRPAGGDRH
jgi:uncharacterized protein YecE (DUF72 family)